jgi:DNA-directed RNA polymerase subunit RPC12/RpoP
MFGIFVCLMIIFLHAWLNGILNGEFTTMVDINSRNEAHVEFFILIVVLLPIFIMTVVWSFLDWKATWRARDQIRFNQYFFEPDEPAPRTMETILMRCSGCHEVFGVTAVENQMNIECPHCGRSGMVKLPDSFLKKSPQYAAGSPGSAPARDYSPGEDFDSSDGPQVRIIKDIRDR